MDQYGLLEAKLSTFPTYICHECSSLTDRSHFFPLWGVEKGLPESLVFPFHSIHFCHVRSTAGHALGFETAMRNKISVKQSERVEVTTPLEEWSTARTTNDYHWIPYLNLW